MQFADLTVACQCFSVGFRVQFRELGLVLFRVQFHVPDLARFDFVFYSWMQFCRSAFSIFAVPSLLAPAPQPYRLLPCFGLLNFHPETWLR
jgi:hypothetical protein